MTYNQLFTKRALEPRTKQEKEEVAEFLEILEQRFAG